MHLRLSGKLFIAALALSVACVALVLGLIWWSFASGFSRFIAQSELNRMDRLATEVASHIETFGLDSLKSDPKAWESLLRSGLLPPPRSHRHDDEDEGGGRESRREPDRREEPPPPLPPPLRHLTERLVLLSPEEQVVAGAATAAESDIRRPLVSGERLLGWLAVAPAESLAQGVNRRFAQSQRRNLLVIGVGTLLLAALVALLLGRNLGRPISAMARTTRQLRAGNYASRVATDRHDELGQLASDINALAAALEAAEAGRRRWVQDTAHELRTPLSVLRAEIEALQDGVRQADQESLARLHASAMTLTELVEDLRALADADGGRLSLQLQPQPLWPLVEAAVDDLRPQAAARRLEIVLSNAAGEADRAPLDGRRIAQVLRNLIANALAYSDPGGRLEIRMERREGCLEIRLDDTPPAVPAEHLPHLFDRFYRVEGSRSRATGGRGLGLSICKAIVAAHGGSILAEPSPLGGLRVRIALPLNRAEGNAR